MSKLIPWPDTLKTSKDFSEFGDALGMLAGALQTIELQEWIDEHGR